MNENYHAVYDLDVQRRIAKLEKKVQDLEAILSNELWDMKINMARAQADWFNK